MGRMHRTRRWAAVALAGVLGAGDSRGLWCRQRRLFVPVGHAHDQWPIPHELRPQRPVQYQPYLSVGLRAAHPDLSQGGYEPGIVGSWEYSKNNTVFTMKIRHGIKFQDGTDVTAKSVVDTLNYYKSLISSPEHPYTRALLQSSSVGVAPRQLLPVIAGTVPTPGSWPLGCRFASRCDFVEEACLTGPIPMVPLNEGADARCVVPASDDLEVT